MKKKSHISLARYLVDNMQVQDLRDHKKAFYIGSILPDIKPSFLTKRHTIDETFDDLMNEIKKITVDYDINKGINSYYARHLGVITHYLSDYCTFPHNTVFKGSIKQHLHYENNLKDELKEYMINEDVQRERSQTFQTYEDIIRFIRKAHMEYLKALKVVHEDIQYIIDLCYKVVDAILMFFEMAINKLENELAKNQNIQMKYSRA